MWCKRIKDKNYVYFNLAKKQIMRDLLMTGTTIKSPDMNPKLYQFYSEFNNSINGITKVK